MRPRALRTRTLGLSLALSLCIFDGRTHALTPDKASTPLRERAFALPELYISSATVPLADVLDRLPNATAWRAHAARQHARGTGKVRASIDKRSGVASAFVESFPLIPGSGVGNHVTLQSLSELLGRPVTVVDRDVVADATLVYLRSRADVLGVHFGGSNFATVQVTPDLWHVVYLASFSGVQSSATRVRVAISHGNVVMAGAANVHPAPPAGVAPAIGADAALAAGRAFAGSAETDTVASKPELQVVPTAPPEHQDGERFIGPIGSGYGARLVWTYLLKRTGETDTWEVLVDAHSGELVAFVEATHYAKRAITGGVYPLTNTEVCPTPQTCGTMLPNAPMPFADTGLAAPNDFANGAGVFEYPGGTVRTQLQGRYVEVRSGNHRHELEASSTFGSINLGGSNGQHDLTGPTGAESTNNPSMRTAFYELNKLFEIGRGYLPNNVWLKGLTFDGIYPLQIDATVNIENLDGPFACNAFYDSFRGEIGFAHSGVDLDGSVCRNTGENADTIAHEWGHALDDNDSLGDLSNSSEGYADIAGMYRTQTSCLGTGMFLNNPDQCGTAPDGTGANVNESQENGFGAGPYCTTNCSGVRDADFLKHDPPTPATAVGFVCGSCRTVPIGSGARIGPCGKQVHCASTPVRQAAWDLAARELTAAPFHYNSETAFLVANRLFYQGSGAVGLWFACACGNTGGSHGCDAENGYMQWLATDDDNGSLEDGTPHMTALHSAFTRHGIACQSLPPVNSGCPSGPAESPILTVTPGHYQARLSWTAVPGATRYWVYRSEGHAGCGYGKARIAEVQGLAYTDTEVAAGRQYSYNVVAGGASESCFGRASICKQVTPTAGTYNVSCSPSALTIYGTGSARTTCSITSVGGYASAVSLGCAGLPNGAACTAVPAEVTLPANGSASVAVDVRTGVAPLSPGTHAFTVRGTPSAHPNSTHAAALTLKVPATGDDLEAVFDPGLKTPHCPNVVGRSCDTGTLVVGRGAVAREPNHPNTIGASCADGEQGVGANDRVRVATVDGTPFTTGGEARITATVNARANFIRDAADFFFAEDAANPAWVYIGTAVPTAAGPQTLSTTYRLPRGGQQAVRVQFRSAGTAQACAAGTLADRDDLAFAVRVP